VTGVPDSVDELNHRGQLWVHERVHGRVHRSTGVTPAARFETERGFLSPLPRRRFDTDYVETRRVHRALPFITWDGVRYSVPPECLGQAVEARVGVDNTELVVSWAGRVVARHHLVPGGGDVWDPTHRAAAETAALASTRSRHLHVVEPAPDQTTTSERLELGDGDFDIAAPDLRVYDGGAGA